MKRAVFLDRDGVIVSHPNEDAESRFIYKKEHVQIPSGVSASLKKLKTEGYLLLVISNQSVIAEGISTPEEVDRVNEFINSKLGGLIDKFYYCPHHPTGHGEIPESAKKFITDCDCRKPEPGLLLAAAKDFSIDLKESWLIGDMISDIVAGKRAGCKTILVESPHSGKIITASRPFDTNIKPDYFVKNLAKAASIIALSSKN